MKDIDYKLLAVVSYLTFVGWIIAFILHRNNNIKPSFVSFHLRQSLGLLVTYLVVGVVGFIFHFVPFLGWLLLTAIYLVLFLLIILGILNAANEKEKAVPLIGSYYQEIFKNVL